MVAIDRGQLRRRWLGVAWCAALLVLIASLISPPDTAPQYVFGLDKLLHALVYAALMFCYSKAYAKSFWLILALALTTYGGAIELLQQLTPARSSSIPDAIANLLGISIMLAILYRGVRDDSLAKGT